MKSRFLKKTIPKANIEDVIETEDGYLIFYKLGNPKGIFKTLESINDSDLQQIQEFLIKKYE